MDNFNDYAINVDAECINQDFDDVDLYGNKYEEEENDRYGDDIQYE